MYSGLTRWRLTILALDGNRLGKQVDGKEPVSMYYVHHLTYSRWTSLPSCLWSLRIFPSLPGSRLTIFYRDASSALLQLVNQWLTLRVKNERADAERDSRTCLARSKFQAQRGTRNIRFPCSAEHKQDWLRYPVGAQ